MELLSPRRLFPPALGGLVGRCRPHQRHERCRIDRICCMAFRLLFGSFWIAARPQVKSDLIVEGIAKAEDASLISSMDNVGDAMLVHTIDSNHAFLLGRRPPITHEPLSRWLYNSPMRIPILIFATIIACMTAGSAFPASSRYTDLGTACRTQRDETLVCPGLLGHRVSLADNGNLTQVTIRPPSRGPSAVFQAQVVGKKLEWRMSAAGGRDVPYAAIIRLAYVDGSETIGQVMGLAKLTPTGSCLMGFVAVASNPDANAVARKIADERAPGFDCARGAVFLIGIVSPDLAVRLPVR